MRQKLSKQNLLLVGFTLFSMFFGAGNLIFPPFLGARAGVLTWKAMSGFLLSAVGLPVLGVAAVALSGGIGKLAGRVHRLCIPVYPSYLSLHRTVPGHTQDLQYILRDDGVPGS